MFDLSQIKPIKRVEPPKMVVYSGPKAGKTTFANGAPSPIFIQCEEGLGGITASAFPLAKSLDDVYQAIDALKDQDHDFTTCIIDSIDWLEPLVSKHVCDKIGLDTLGDVSKGWGKGWEASDKEWAKLLLNLDSLRKEKGMIIILISHSEVKKSQPPDGEPYDYLGLKLHKRAAAIVEEWADVIGFVSVKRALKKDDNAKNKRAIGTGIRELIVGPNPAYVTGNRYGLPDKMALDFDVFLDEFEKATG